MVMHIDEQVDRLVVTLDRPAKRNAIDVDVVNALHEVCARLEQAPKLLLLTGGDQGIFAAGADIAQLKERDRMDALAAINASIFNRIAALPMPTVAAVDGPALGGGAELAYACDLRVCSERSFFGQPEVRLGIIAGAGATHRLPALVGPARAKELLFTGRRVPAAEALAMGLVNRVVPADQLLSTAHEMLDEIGKGSALALRLTKWAVDSPAAAHPQVDLVMQAVLFEDEEKHRRMQAFLDR